VCRFEKMGPKVGGRWAAQRLGELFELGFVSIGRFTGSDRVSFSYVTENLQSLIDAGAVAVVGRDITAWLS